MNAQLLFDNYEKFKETSLTNRRFKHKDILPLINKLSQNEIFEVQLVGKSTEKRELYKIAIGSGKINIMLWSQMHGDEPTATMANFDIFNFFITSGDEFDELRKIIVDNCRLHFVPMLNPDGAERYQRRTALEIDMNRDALRTITPEAVVLKHLQQSIKPAFGFNLHDQSIRYSVGCSFKQASISFLATAFDADRSWNATRTRSMQVICAMNKALKPFIGAHMAKFSDEFEPRAFGDNIQKWGTSLILLESGGYPNDTEKQYLRKINFMAILIALETIATQSYTQFVLNDYEAIPNNEKCLFDLLIKNATLQPQGKIVDIGINLAEKNIDDAKHFELISTIEDIGDLSIYGGIKEFDAKGLTIIQNKLTFKVGEQANFGLENNGQLKFIVENGILQVV